jgi:ketosteroid isomerase-like protein
MTLPTDLPGSLDAVHVAMRDAFARADLPAYAEYLARDLRYVDARGRVQSREQLLSDVQRQFERLVSFRSQFTRESLVADGEAVIETGVQDGAIALRIFAFFEVRWQITRRGRYTWRRTNGGRWHLSEVVLFSETIRRDGLGLADRARFAGPSEDPA